MWTSFGTKDVTGVVKRLGLNFGAVGDRKADDGTLWLEYPSIGGVSPAVQVKTTPAKPEVFRRHSSVVTGPYGWVTSSGVKNVSEISVSLGEMEGPRPYTVKLFFAEPENLAAGKRVFNVDIGGKRVLSDFDIAKEAGGSLRTVIREFKGTSAQGNITIRLTPTVATAKHGPILCGLELIADGNP